MKPLWVYWLYVGISVLVLLMQIAALRATKRNYKLQRSIFDSWQQVYESLSKRIEKLERLERERNNEGNGNPKLRHH